MSWQKTKISEFLTERKDRFKPDKANELGLETYSRNENVSRDLIWRLHLAANKYLSDQK